MFWGRTSLVGLEKIYNRDSRERVRIITKGRIKCFMRYHAWKSVFSIRECFSREFRIPSPAKASVRGSVTKSERSERTRGLRRVVVIPEPWSESLVCLERKEIPNLGLWLLSLLQTF